VLPSGSVVVNVIRLHHRLQYRPEREREREREKGGEGDRERGETEYVCPSDLGLIKPKKQY
jgi:hypothetical protein